VDFEEDLVVVVLEIGAVFEARHAVVDGAEEVLVVVDAAVEE